MAAEVACRGGAAGFSLSLWERVGVRGLTFALLLSIAPPLRAQYFSNLEPERPIAIEDATPVPYRAISGAIDWTYNVRRGGLDDQGPGLSLAYGLTRALEVGASQRYVTSPGRNALRGISSGDLGLHALYAFSSESAGRPALAGRVGVVFPTGLDSRGTDLELTLLATRSFEGLRLHANVGWTRLGDILPTERADRFAGGLAVDFLASGPGRTDTLLLAGVSVRSSHIVEQKPIFQIELGVRQRIGMQTIFFGGAGSEFSEAPNRPRLSVRLGMAHFF